MSTCLWLPKRRSAWGFAASCIIALGLVSGATAEPFKIKLQYASTSQLVPIIPLAPKEIYKHYGKSYVVEPVFMAGAGPALTAYAANEVHIATLNPQSIANAVATAKLDITAFVQVFSTDVPGNASSEFWAQDSIKKIEDLRGRPVGINTRGSTPEAGARIVFARHGLKDGDWQPVELPFPANLPALESKRVDAAILVLPFNLLAAKKPGLHKLFTVGDAFGASESVLWTAKPEFLAKNRAMLVDFIEDHIRFRHWALNPKTRMEAIKLIAQVDKRPVENYEYMFSPKDQFRHPNGLINIERFQKNVNDLAAAGTAAATIDAKKHIDVSIVNEAAARLGTH
jgi:NitT/TauT family transport system substrate-binding protein